jgi:hypothetical protein
MNFAQHIICIKILNTHFFETAGNDRICGLLYTGYGFDD